MLENFFSELVWWPFFGQKLGHIYLIYSVGGGVFKISNVRSADVEERRMKISDAMPILVDYFDVHLKGIFSPFSRPILCRRVGTPFW